MGGGVYMVSGLHTTFPVTGIQMGAQGGVIVFHRALIQMLGGIQSDSERTRAVF